MSRVAIVTDSASDLTTEQARAAGIRIVPLEVTFGFDAHEDALNEGEVYAHIFRRHDYGLTAEAVT